MPVIKISQKDIDKSKAVSAGWHLYEIGQFTENDSRDKGSKNWVFELVCVDNDENKDRYSAARFNSKAPGIMVSSGFLPSALDTPIDTEMDFNPEELRGKRLYGNTKAETFEGKIQMKTEEFCPASRPPF